MRRIVTIAHEGGHVVAAVLTRRHVMRVHVHPDGSGVTWTQGKPGFGRMLVLFCGYPFPAVLGAGLLVAVVHGSARLLGAAVAVALLLLLERTRGLHGWLLIAACAVGSALAVWFAPGTMLALGLAALGSLLLAGSIRDLLSERRRRRDGHRDSDVSVLARRWMPAPLWWSAMLAVVCGSGWWAWTQAAGVYSAG
jgi:hypothetical protein